MACFKKIDFEILHNAALTEGEGLGTAYEYYAKLDLLNRFVSGKKIRSVLVLGLPEKYGLSLDFALFAYFNGFELAVADERKNRLSEFRKALEKLARHGFKINAEIIHCSNLSDINPRKRFGLVASCEVIQRLGHARRKDYAKLVLRLGEHAAIFAPNRGNKMHSRISGLDSLYAEELLEIFSCIKGWKDYGYIDMPPFPPGIRSKSRKKQGGIISGVLPIWLNLEKISPKFLRKRFGHIVYFLA